MAKTTKADRVDATTSAQAALALLMRHGAAELTRQLRAVMTSDHSDGPHKARVALRRLRVALAAFKPIVAKPLYADLHTDMRATFRSLGTLRDADVLAQTLNLPGLFAAADTTRRSVRADLKSARATGLGRRITRAFGGKSWHRKGTKRLRHAPAAGLAVRALTRIWLHLRDTGPDLTGLPPDTRHELRKALKTLRYLCDDFAALWPGPDCDAFLTRLKALQEDLGTLNDHATARSHGFDAPDDAPFLAAAQTDWTALRASPVWWQTPRQT